MKRLIRYFLTFAFALSILLTFVACRNDDNSSGNDTSGNDTSIPDGDNHVCTTDPCEICGSEGLEYALRPDGMSYAVIGIGDFKGTDLVIPGTYNGLPVTEIGTEAFYRCYHLTSIVIPDSITAFGEVCCPDLTPYVRNEGFRYNEYDNAYYIGNSSNPYLLLVMAKDGEITSCTIHPDTKAIYSAAFGGCRGLTEISVPEGVTHIMAWAFSNCQNLGALDLPDSLEYLGDGAIDDCYNLPYTEYNGVKFFGTEKSPYTVLISATSTDITSFDVPDGTKFIYDAAFWGCRSLTEIKLPSGLKSIGGCAFYWCSDLVEIDLPEGLEVIGSYAFSKCSSLTSMIIPDSVITLGSFGRIPPGSAVGRHIRGGVFGQCTALENVVVGNGVSVILSSTFFECASLESVTLPDCIREIWDEAFYGCSSLSALSIPSSLEKTGDDVFNSCDSLSYNAYGNAKYLGNPDDPYIVLVTATSTGITSCEINADTSFILSSAFKNCVQLTSIEIPENVTSIGDYAFAYCAQLTSIEIPGSVATISDGAFEGCTSLTDVKIGDGVKEISYYAFQGCTSLKTVTFGDSIETIYPYAFSGCESLESVILPDSVIYIETEAFYGCESLKSVTLGNNVTSIGNYAFSGSPYLTEIIVPKSVTTLGIYAFENCENLTIYCEATSKPEGWNDYWNIDVKDVVWGYNG